jgi:hypothetical protein
MMASFPSAKCFSERNSITMGHYIIQNWIDCTVEKKKNRWSNLVDQSKYELLRKNNHKQSKSFNTRLMFWYSCVHYKKIIKDLWLWTNYWCFAWEKVICLMQFLDLYFIWFNWGGFDVLYICSIVSIQS